MWLRATLGGAVLLGVLAVGAAAQETTPVAPGAPAAPAAPAASAAQAEPAEPAAQDRIAMLKQSFAASKAALKEYEWVETVVVSIGGEEKVRQENKCYYGAEGKLQKTPISPNAKEDKKRGLRGKAVESKKAEIQASLKSATALIHQYVPLDPAKIEAAKTAGNLSTSTPAADGSIRVTIKNYLKPGDEVIVDVDGAKNTLKGVAIASFVEEAKAKNPVKANVTYAALPDGTLYPGKEALEVGAQNMKIDVENAGYKKLAK